MQPETVTTKPAVLLNEYPVFDSARNRLQHIRLRFVCGHNEDFYLLDLGKGWKPRTSRQLVADYLRITCPEGWKLCQACSEGPRPEPFAGKTIDAWLP